MLFLKTFFVVLIIVLSFSHSSAWIGLFGESGDVITTARWNNMITNLHTKINQNNITGTGNIDVSLAGSGVLISFTGSVEANPIPYITSGNKSILTSSTSDIHIEGLNFMPTSTVTIPGFGGTINSTTINGPTDLDINVTSVANTGTYDFVITNTPESNTSWAGNGVGQLHVFITGVWKDLRSGGDSFSHGNGTGNDIRYKSGMSLSRDANGMFFSGVSPWSSWVKFESLGWTRGTNKTLSWVFSRPSNYMMIGIGSTATNEGSTTQYYQSELVSYFPNSTSLWGFYGNGGTPGFGASQSSTSGLTCASNTFKSTFTNDGTKNISTYTLYCLPSASQVDWDNTSVVVHTVTISTLDPDEVNIMPFIIPQNGGSQRFIAVKVH